MAVFTIAGLTLKEAVRRRTLVGALLLGLLVIGLSVLASVIHYRMSLQVVSGRRDPMWLAMQYPLARSTVMSLCLSATKSLGGLFALLMAGGSISGEIERGMLAVILPKPIPRWQILLGKWLGLNVVLMGSVVVWTVMIWLSFTIQMQRIDKELDLTPLLRAGPLLALFPLVVSTLTLSLSTFAQRIFGTSLALAFMVTAWMDGIFNTIGETFDVDVMHVLADIAGLLMPQGYIAWWVEKATDDLILPSPRGGLGESSRLLIEWGQQHLHFAHLDAVYLVFYVVVVFLFGAIVFQQRDV